jgi:hypothetical protein
MHTGKYLEAHLVQKGSLSCDSDAPQVGSARFDSTRVVKLNRRKTNRRNPNILIDQMTPFPTPEDRNYRKLSRVLDTATFMTFSRTHLYRGDSSTVTDCAFCS